MISILGVKNLPTEFGGELEMPNEPIGQHIYEYMHKFEKKFEGNPHPFILYSIFLFEILTKYYIKRTTYIYINIYIDNKD